MKNLAFALALSASAFVPSANAAPLVEMYTSQGCSSCPPADALMKDLTRRDDIVALSFHVDYWDRLGWPDTLASPTWSARQRDLARTRRDGRVYTPQAVVSRAHAVGSDARRISRMTGQDALGLSASLQGGRLSVTLPEGRGGRLVVARFSKAKTVEIGRGENRGRTIDYRHSVLDLAELGAWSGEAGTLAFDAPALNAGEGLAVIALDKAGIAQGAAYAAR